MKPPKFLHDLYADLRDRKLLPLVAVLFAAIVAVPLLLKSETSSPPMPAAETAELPDGIPLPAVLASEPGLRDYRDRLESLSSKNPFASDAAGSAIPSDSAIEAATDAASEAGAPAGPESGGGGSTGETVTESSSTSTSTETTVTEDSSTSGSGGSGSSRPEVVELAFRVDVEVGPAGNAKRRKNVKLLTSLPSQSNPVLLFLGAGETGKRATFLVSEDVVTARGDGKCVPSPSECELLVMKRNDEMKLGYAPQGEPDTFVIRLLDINLERNEETAESDRRKEKRDDHDSLAGARSFFGG